MKVTEELAVLTALSKAIRERLNEVRATADEELLAAYEEDGVTKKALKIGGTKVGDYLLTFGKDPWAVTDQESFEDFALCNGLADLEYEIPDVLMPQAVKVLQDVDPDLLVPRVTLRKGWEKFIDDVGGSPVLGGTDAVVPGIQAVGAQVKNTSVRGCKPEDVLPILRQLGGVETLLLGEGTAEGDTAAGSDQ